MSAKKIIFILLFVLHALPIHAQSNLLNLPSDNNAHENQLFEPSAFQPSPLPVHVWVNVTNRTECELSDTTEMMCQWDNAVAFGSEQVRFTYLTDAAETVQLHHGDTELRSQFVFTQGVWTEETYRLAQPAETLSFTVTTAETIEPDTLKMVVELRRDTVAADCQNGVLNEGRLGLNLGVRDYLAEQDLVTLIKTLPPEEAARLYIDELLPVRASNVAVEVEKLQALGVDWVRFPIVPMRFGGAVVDAETGDFELGEIDWGETIEQYKVQVDNLCDRGINVMPVLTEMIALGYPVDSTTDPDSSQYAYFQNAYVNAVADVANGLPTVRRWQVWNEPNLGGDYFSLEGENRARRLEQFTGLVKLIDETITFVQPQFEPQIVLGSISDVWLTGGANWLGYLYNQDVLGWLDDHIDYVGVHLYSYSIVSDDGDETNDTIRSIDPNHYLTEPDVNGVGGSPLEAISAIVGEMPIMVTEIGWDASAETADNDITYGVDQCAYNNPVTDNLDDSGTIVSDLLQARFLEDSYDILLDSDVTHYPERPGESNVSNAIFWYRYDDIKIEVEEQYQIGCAGSAGEVVNPRASVAGAKPIGLASYSISDQRRKNEPVIPINHWWGLIDENGGRKPAYCAYMRVAVSQGSLDALTDERCSDVLVPTAVTVHTVHFGVAADSIHVILIVCLLSSFGTAQIKLKR